MKTFKDWFIATRPWSFVMTFFSITLGTIIASFDGKINFFYYFLCLSGAIFYHAASNLINDYFDFKKRVDLPDSPTAHYRPHPIITEKFSSKEILLFSLFMYFLTFLIGIFFTFKVSYLILIIGLLGFLISFSYCGFPFSYKYKALGEIPIFLAWGPLMVSGAYIVQRAKFSKEAALISIPIGILVSLVLFANNLRDIEYDKRQGIKTLAILLGHKGGLNFYLGFIIFSYFALIVLTILKILSPFGLLAFLSVPKAYKLFKDFKIKVPDGADAITSQLVVSFGTFLLLGLLFHKIIIN